MRHSAKGPALIDEATYWNFGRDSAKGAKYDSQGQARSASPLDRAKKKALSPEKGEIKSLRDKNTGMLSAITNLTSRKRDQDMPQSLSSILIHLIFSTKGREPFLTPEIDAELYAYMAAIFKAMKSPALIINGTSDHLHTLFSLSRVVTIADLVEEVKTESSKWIKTKGREFRNFHWQSGYGAFSVSQSQVPTVKRYIRRQKEHHRRVTFQDEYRKFLKAYDVEYDERYVWD